MKKITFIIMAALLPTMTFAQLTVDSNGKTSLASTNINGRIEVSHSTNSTVSYPISVNISAFRGLKWENNYNTPQTSSDDCFKLLCNANTTGLYSGIHADSENLSTGNGHAVGVRGVGKVNGTGIAYGVIASKRSTRGAGIFASSAGSLGSSAITGSYAGYFSGDIKVTGTIDGTLVNSSDARLKENVQALDESFGSKGASILEQLDMLTPVSFKYKKIEETNDETMSEEGEEEVEEVPNPVMEKEHFGLIAQELQKVYPNLVYEKDNGYLAVNYVELVPVLMQAIKELNAKVEELSGNTSARKTMTTETTSINSSSLPAGEGGGRGFLLSQNVPNPFTEKTDIAIYLPESVQIATLYIYDLSGKQLEQHPVTGRGNTVMTIHADKMDAGMYVYSLVADKKVITAKKMIVTK